MVQAGAQSVRDVQGAQSLRKGANRLRRGTRLNLVFGFAFIRFGLFALALAATDTEDDATSHSG